MPCSKPATPARSPTSTRGRGPTVYFQQMDAPRPQRNRIHIDVWVPHDQAEQRVAVAITAGGHLVTDEHAPGWWVLADPEGNEACVVAHQPVRRVEWNPDAGPLFQRADQRVLG